MAHHNDVKQLSKAVEAVGHAVAGGVAGMAAIAAFYPLSSVSTRFANPPLEFGSCENQPSLLETPSFSFTPPPPLLLETRNFCKVPFQLYETNSC